MGLFSHSDDQIIASRIENILHHELGYSVCNFDKFAYPAGIPQRDKASVFIENCMCVLWIATPSLTKCQGYPREHGDLLHHNSIKNESIRGVKNFIVLFPKEFLDNRPPLPSGFDAYDPLPEDDRFSDRVKATFDRIKTKCRKQLAKKSSIVVTYV